MGVRSGHQFDHLHDGFLLFRRHLADLLKEAGMFLKHHFIMKLYKTPIQHPGHRPGGYGELFAIGSSNALTAFKLCHMPMLRFDISYPGIASVETSGCCAPE